MSYIAQDRRIIPQLKVQRFIGPSWNTRWHICGESGKPLCGCYTTDTTPKDGKLDLAKVDCHFCKEIMNYRPTEKDLKDAADKDFGELWPPQYALDYMEAQIPIADFEDWTQEDLDGWVYPTKPPEKQKCESCSNEIPEEDGGGLYWGSTGPYCSACMDGIVV